MKFIIFAISLLLNLTAFAAGTESTPVANAQVTDYAEGKAAIEKKDYRAAVKAFSAALKKEPKSADILTMLGFSVWNENIKNKDQALDYYNQALKIDPSHIGANQYMGKLYVKINSMDKAKAQLAILQKICGNDDCTEYKDLKKMIESAGKTNSSDKLEY